VVESGWSWEEHDFIKNSEMEPFEVRCKKLIDTIKRFPEAKYFLEPVSVEQVPTYYTVIKNPMDFRTIMEKLAKGNYTNEEQLCEDL
jgi:hypothetical protein